MSVGREARRRAKLLARILPLFGGEAPPIPEAPEVDLIFADDSSQTRPSRPGMGPLVAIGGVNVAAEVVAPLQRAIDKLCTDTGFPAGEPFKWSPGRDLWMSSNLQGEARATFYARLMALLVQFEAVVAVVAADTNARAATGAPTPQVDVTRMFLERVNHQVGRGGAWGFIIADRPGGDRADEQAFLAECLSFIQSGTQYVKPDRIAHNVLTTNSRLSRLIQAADVVTSCTLAMVAGEPNFAPPVFKSILPLMDRRDADRIGGYGLKLHPALRYGNLYHWLLGDSHFWRGNAGTPMPIKTWPYATGPTRP